MRLVADLSAAGRRLDQRVGQILAGGHDQRRVTAAGVGTHTAIRAGNRDGGDHLAGRVANRRGNRTHALIAFIDRLGQPRLRTAVSLAAVNLA